ncbi:MAG: ABC transporter permease [Paracoccus sp. (in: a-proteobacteria)]|uniref:ABC transporter permease n=1 Tax=Paracoccus sp. TaxID=267 RepID=UPI0039E52122
MLKLALRRLMVAPLLVAVVTFVIFCLVAIMPGDPAVLLAGDDLSLVPKIREAMGLDKPLLMRYAEWAAGAISGDLGRSFQTGQVAVSALLVSALPVTLSLVAIAMVISIIFALVFGILAGVNEGKWIDRVISAFCAIAIATPTFWLGYLLVLAFAVKLGWLPSLGYTAISEGVLPWLRNLILPALTLAPASIAILTLQLRGGLLTVFDRPYMLSAQAKGISGGRLLFNHALRNAAIPAVTLLGFQLSSLIGGSVLVEHVFSIPGIGTLAINATLNGDLPVVLGIITTTTVLVVLINAISDLIYGYLNPRIRA